MPEAIWPDKETILRKSWAGNSNPILIALQTIDMANAVTCTKHRSINAR